VYAGYSANRGRQKKVPPSDLGSATRRAEGHSLEAFHDRLLDLCANDLSVNLHTRASQSEDQAKRACSLASELGILKQPGITWLEFREAAADLHFCSEHAVEFSTEYSLVAKFTIPPNFGLIPQVLTHPVINLRDDPSLPATRQAIEFVPATPLEYLERWIAANEVFGDDVRLTAVIEWADGQVSFAISQPQYHGEPATPREIESFFEASGWKRFIDSSDHVLFYNYAFQVLAIDALPRNCYLHDGGLLPFDVILCKPDEGLERLLALYPS
jgi:hypothetical protein